MVRSRFHLALAALAPVLLVGCGIFGGAAPTPVVRPTPVRSTPTSVATATPTPAITPAPLSTPTPVPAMSRRSVEQAVWAKLSSCAEGVALAAQAEVGVIFSPVYRPEEGKWLVEVTSKTPALTFGLWEVVDATGAVTPKDEVARTIASPGILCGKPAAFLSPGLTPPLFTTAPPVPPPTPTAAPTRTPTPTPEVSTANEAALRVWVAVYNCYRYWPESPSFVAYQESPERWIVEGKSGTTQYGLWAIAALTGEITPLDPLAERANRACAASPVVTTAEGAALRVWAAVYSCFDPRPADSDFKAHQDTPDRWFVEGRSEKFKALDVVYGLWVVDSETAAITPWDQLALDTAAKACYKKP